MKAIWFINMFFYCELIFFIFRMRNSPTLSLILRHHMRCFHLDKNQWQESKSEPGVFWKDLSIGHCFQNFLQVPVFLPFPGTEPNPRKPRQAPGQLLKPFHLLCQIWSEPFLHLLFPFPIFFTTSSISLHCRIWGAWEAIFYPYHQAGGEEILPGHLL